MAWPPTFGLDSESVLNLLTGDRFYSSEGAALREVILNAVDACTRRSQTENQFKPTIDVTFNKEIHSVSVRDNGIGMNREELEGIFTEIGQSSSEAAPSDISLVGEFGIGVASYFLISDAFHVQTKTEEGPAIGLTFKRSMFEGSEPAEPFEVDRTQTGTQVSLDLKDEVDIEDLITEFPERIRSVEGLTATIEPSGERLPQGGKDRSIATVDVDPPDWAEKVEIGPPSDVQEITPISGKASVDLLYRGVFVDNFEVNGLWGLQGAIHVDPSDFKPLLNREGFLKEDYENILHPFLKEIHPDVLLKLLKELRKGISPEGLRNKKLRRWVTLWLSVPRDKPYREVSDAWDETTRSLKAFKMLTVDDTKNISLKELESSSSGEIYSVAENYQNRDAVLQQAVKILRSSETPIITGIEPDKGYLPSTPITYSSTRQILINELSTDLDIRPLNKSKKQIVDKHTDLESVFPGSPSVKAVKLDESSTGVLVLDNEAWINVGSSQGREIIRYLCDENPSLIGLLIAIQQHGQHEIQSISNHISSINDLHKHHIGPVRRRVLRRLLR